MPPSPGTTSDIYLLILPAIFGFVLPFVAAIGFYQCISYSRAKAIYEKRILVVRKKLRHRLRQFKAEGVVTPRHKMREHGFKDLCELSSDDDDHTTPGSSPRRENHSLPSDSRTSDRTNSQRSTNRSGEPCPSFVLEDVSMLESEEGSSDDSW
ncbi:hypothetical protein conserved [Leishmania donovani]|uniref:Uncharacterized protein n=3 Tax=Leishmania donovani species complex TaxID=38574 RepID=A4I707_LEIIN|nr:hypothetical protein, unknown function [Leishmania infantum JPCM5]XP_003863319.1 hypothetical protein, unknown function [Leishmania donovani]CAC9520565.1 hypothetical_protein_-_conserved [Leishmania infantum]AYU81438.1 hypothetical protein LdCL_310031100 [Leishmania donovani]TPP41394.1 hypothetical protein CGC20_3020 [Leishmania donovani]TPP42540.1 hypothetical protein CGC21_11125 [Leishmania donovani]TPP54480.1 hypothetical protein CGC20_9690 [Leishmania donovani]|eukprot:XP_001467526.1 hypothetical protein, unknown function [Leishmania infantum JPCM5]